MPNALAQESSPYLRQHADNPVHWLPWSGHALELAKQQNKPILLSIGYSACHWCHVMAHESFENDETAKLMNQHFINIKVDREERPDLDKIYQAAHQLMAQRPGGWPLTMFLSPQDQVPFYGGTYFPDQPRYGMISFSDLLEQISAAFRDQHDKILQHTEAMQQALINISQHESSNQGHAAPESLQAFESQLLQLHDREYGGFGQAPKFPQAAMLRQAIRRAMVASAEDELYQALDFSLQKIALGGIQDHLAGGFYRYSVDDKWMIPHFEKMLYDNGQLLTVFAFMTQLTGRQLYRQAVEGIVTWLEQEMLTETGSFYAALDADSEGIEGKYYVWTPAQVQALLSPAAYALFAAKYGLDRAPNFEGEWHLHAYLEDQALAQKFNLDQSTLTSELSDARQLLLQSRARRIKPGLDNKILTAWNALVIQGLAISARVLARPEYYLLANRCLAALRVECWHQGRLLALSQQSGNQLRAYLDDYAHLLSAVLDCLQYQWDTDQLVFAQTLAQQLLDLFEDREQGGFYFTARDHEQLIQRPKSWQDEAMPCGNAVAAQALYRLGLLIGERRYTEAAENALQSVADSINQNPLYAASFLGLLEEVEAPPLVLIVSGERAQLLQWQERIWPRLGARQLAFFIPAGIEHLPDSLAQKTAVSKTTAWLCEGFSCQPPVTDLDHLIEKL